MPSADAPLACPRCGAPHAEHERRCERCAMPLVVKDGGLPPSEAQIEARKIHPRYARGALVRVAVGRNQAEAELIKGVLLEQGIPSMLRRTGGFDVPDFLAAGPRDVLVPESGAEAARELLSDVGAAEPQASGADVSFGPSHQMRLLAALLAGLLLFGALAGVLRLLAG